MFRSRLTGNAPPGILTLQHRGDMHVMKRAETQTAPPDERQALPYSPSIERAVGPMPGPQVLMPGPFAEMASLCPLGVLDSGLGGLSIVEELWRTVPHENIIYYADNANCPYGARSDEWVRARSLEI